MPGSRVLSPHLWLKPSQNSQEPHAPESAPIRSLTGGKLSRPRAMFGVLTVKFSVTAGSCRNQTAPGTQRLRGMEKDSLEIHALLRKSNVFFVPHKTFIVFVNALLYIVSFMGF